MKYVIKKGKHYSKFNLARLFPFIRLPLQQEIKFDKHCWYDIDSVEYTGYNKLTGVSGLNIHKNSARFVWQPDFHTYGIIKLYGYVYSDGGHWKDVYLCSVKTDTRFKVEIQYINNGWQFKVYVDGRNTIEVYTKFMVGTKPKGICKYLFKAFPYFGGKSVAPKDIIVYVKKSRI